MGSWPLGRLVAFVFFGTLLVMACFAGSVGGDALLAVFAMIGIAMLLWAIVRIARKG